MKAAPTQGRSVCTVALTAIFAIFLMGCGQGNAANTAGNGNSAGRDDIPQDTEGKLQLAYKHYLGAEIPLNYPKASQLFRQCAEAGNSEAQFALGVMHQNGQGVPINYLEAAKWYLQSARQDNPNGQYLLGLSYKEGSGVAKDPVEAYKWLDLAADHGHGDHIEARDQLALLLTPDLVAEGERRAAQFRTYDLPALQEKAARQTISTPSQTKNKAVNP